MERDAFEAEVDSVGIDGSDLPERVWRLVEPILPTEPPKPQGGKPREHHDRPVLAGILFVARHGIGWTKLPLELGYASGQTCRRRLREWQQAGVWDKVRAVLIEEIEGTETFDWTRIERTQAQRSEARIRDADGIGAGSKAHGRRAAERDRLDADLHELRLMVQQARDLTEDDVDSIHLHAPSLIRRAESLSKRQVGSEIREIARCMRTAAHVWLAASYQEVGNPASLEDGLWYARRAQHLAEELAPPTDSFWYGLAHWYEGVLLRKQAKFLAGSARDTLYRTAFNIQHDLVDETVWPELRGFAFAELIKLGLATDPLKSFDDPLQDFEEWERQGRLAIATALNNPDSLAEEDPRPRAFPEHVNAVFFDAVIRSFQEFHLQDREPLAEAWAEIERHRQGVSFNISEVTRKLGQAEALLSSPNLKDSDYEDGLTSWLAGWTYARQTAQEQQVLRANGFLRKWQQNDIVLPDEYELLCLACKAQTRWTREGSIYLCTECRPSQGVARLLLPTRDAEAELVFPR